MKRLIMYLFGTFTGIAMFAQTVTVTVKGDRNKQVLIDGYSYTVNPDNSMNNSNQDISISNLSVGSHKIQVVRSNRYGSNTTTSTASYFDLRSGYDVDILVSANGSVSYEERRSQGSTGYNTPMSDANFRVLYNSIQRFSSNASRVNALQNAFDANGNYFSATQVRQLLLLTSSQSSRLTLAKAAYKTVTDTENFDDVYTVLNSQSRRNELQRWVDDYEDNSSGGNTGVAMSDANFRALYNEAQGQWSTSAKMSYLTSVFANANNRFTTAQARQLIGIVYSESDRLSLAKQAYGNVVDPSNYSSLYDLLNSQSSRNELAVYISQNGSSSGTAMSSANFNNLYNVARAKYSYSDKKNYLSSVFGSSTNYFTTAQVKLLVELLNTESDRAQLAKEAWDNIVDQYNYAVLYDLVPSTYYRNDLAAYINAHGQNTGSVGSVRTPMSDASFTSLYNGVSNQWGLGVKYSSLTDIFNDANNWFTVAQVRQLIQLVSDERNRLQLAKLAYNNTVDPANYNQLYDVLASQSSRDELDLFVRTNSNGNSYGVRTPMSGESFTALYNNISNTWGLNAKYSSLTTTFNNTSYYFTTAQARQLIQLVSAETNRLALAKLSYDNIVDPENFNQLYDIFQSQASRNELDSYVNSYSYNRQ